MNLHFDVKLLATGKRDKNLAKKYAQAEKSVKNKTDKTKTTKPKTKLKQQTAMKSCPKQSKITPYWIVVSVFSIIAFFTAIFLLVIK